MSGLKRPVMELRLGALNHPPVTVVLPASSGDNPARSRAPGVATRGAARIVVSGLSACNAYARNTNPRSVFEIRQRRAGRLLRGRV